MNSRTTNSHLTKYFTILLAVLLLVFGAHISILNLLELPLWSDKIVLAYLINGFVACLTLFAMQHWKKKHQPILGYLFLGFSFFKFILFYILFNPSYKIDGEVSGIEFAAFFTPYAICLTTEIVLLIKILNQDDN